MPLASQKSVDYSQGGDACDFCQYFVEDGQDCQKVQGPIYEDMWCRLFKRTQAEHEAETSGEYEQPPNEAGESAKRGMPAKDMALILIGKPRGA